MANNFRIFAQNIDNIRTDSEYINLNERINGFQPQTVISSATMNTALRQSSLVSYAIAKMMDDNGYATGDIGPSMDATTFLDDFEDFMKGYFKEEIGWVDIDEGSLGYWNGHNLVNIPKNTDGSVLMLSNGVPVWSNTIVAGNATYAETAGELSNFRNLSYGTTIKFEFGEEGQKTTFEHEITVEVPGTVEAAADVTNTIAGKLITAIFETNGTTVKKATLATRATNMAGGAAGSIPYQIGSGSTSYLSKPATSSPYFLQMTSSGTPSWVLNADMTVGNATNAGSANTLNMTSNNVGSIPYKNISGNYGVILPPSSTSSSSEFILVTKYSSSGLKGQVPNWQPRQKITVVENSDGTVDVTITNV